MKKGSIIVFFIFLASAVVHGELYAYSTSVHQRLTREAVSQNATSMRTYLNRLYLSAGVNEVQNNKTIEDWIIEGSWMEDVSPDILTSHFYDPITNKGYSVQGVEIGQSAFDRANDLPNYGPWVWARKRMYDGLVETNKLLKEQYLGISFQALGRAMHLVQDMAVPAHARNDLHTADPYELYTNRNYQNLNYSPISFPSGYVSTSSKAPRHFWDIDTYNGSSVPLTATIGLAEYSNANFFSADTIFKDYPHPSYADTTYSAIDWLHPEVTDAEDGKLDNRIYIRKTVGQVDIRMATASYISRDCIKKGYIQYAPWALDDGVHNDYAALLVPRAVGYSAGLLNYFFRGSIDISVPSNGFYSLIDATQAGYTPAFTSIKLKATNSTTTFEDMTNGTIKLVVKYKVAHADPFQSGPVPIDTDFTYIVVPEKNNVSALYSATPTELNFDLPSNNLIPLWATDVYLQVVFKGNLGTETDAVAVGVKDISEPTPMDMFNNMDMICLNNAWYVAGSQAAIDQVDTNHDGAPNEYDIYAHDLTNVYMLIRPYGTFQYASPSAYNFVVASLPAGHFLRPAYILSDYQYYYGDYSTVTAADADDHRSHSYTRKVLAADAVIRQTDYVEDSGQCGGPPACYIDRNPQFTTFRGLTVWGSGEVWNNLQSPINSNCLYVDLP